MMEQIDRDVMRTHPDMHFFSGSDGAAVLHQEVLPVLPLYQVTCCDRQLLFGPPMWWWEQL